MSGKRPAAFPKPLRGARVPANRDGPGLCLDLVPANSYADNPTPALARSGSASLFAGVRELAK